MINLKDHNNIIINQIDTDGSALKFKEVVPSYFSNKSISDNALILRNGSELLWSPIDLSLNIIVNKQIKGTDIYYDSGRIGIGRSPLYNYRFDIAVPRDTIVTALHIGDGSFGFSLGNGTTDGFIPEIIGIGSNEKDAGLYFVGIAGNDQPSNIPLIIMDGRSTYNTQLNNRPIFGITSANYNEYTVLIDCSHNLKLNGNVIADDIVFNDFPELSLRKIIKNLQQQINDLKLK